MTAQLSPTPVQKFFDNNGNPLFNGKLYSYAAGTTTPQATYTDSTMGTANTNPIILNSRGEANVWLDTTLTYKLILQDSSGNQIWLVDNIPGSGVFGTVATIADLRNVTGVGVANYQSIIVDGYTTAGDGGGGIFWWNSSSTTADNGGTIIAPTGVSTGRWYRLYTGALYPEWFGAKGDGTTDDYTAFSNAITALGSTLGILKTFNKTYLIKSPLSWDSNICIEGPGILDVSQITVSSGSPQNAITINASAISWLPEATVLKGIWVKGNQTINGSLNYTQYLTGINYATNVINIENCSFTGFDYAETYANHSYLINCINCRYSSNNNGIYFNSVASSMGENINHIGCVIDTNNNGLYNNQGELHFYGCSFDYNIDSHVSGNITGVGGTSTSVLCFDSCHFENNASTSSGTRFTNSGIMVFNGGIIDDNVSTMFTNNSTGTITLTGDLLWQIPESTNYTVSGTGILRPIAVLATSAATNVRLSAAYSGVANNGFESGSLAPFTISAGTNASVSSASPHTGTYSLAMAPTSSSQNTQIASPKISCPFGLTQICVSAFVKNTNTTSALSLSINTYDFGGNLIASGPVLSVPSGGIAYAVTNGGNPGVSPSGGYVIFYFTIAAGTDTTAMCYIDDIYINFR